MENATIKIYRAWSHEFFLFVQIWKNGILRGSNWKTRQAEDAA